MVWMEFIAAFAVFLLSHSLLLRPPVKGPLVARLGARGFTLAYSLLSILILAWLIRAAGNAPWVGVWDRAPWQTHATLTLMALVCLVLALCLGRPNPFSFGGMHNEGFDPDRPGVVRWVRHPVLLALALWAGAHLLPNGDLAHVLLFGMFAGFAVMGMGLIDRRKRREMGAGRWQALRTQVAAAPLLARPQSWAMLGLRLALGVAAYGALIALHPAVIGVSPLP